MAGGNPVDTVVPIARVLASLAKASRCNDRRDTILHDAIIDALGEVGADALIFRVIGGQDAFAAFRPNIDWKRARKNRTIEVATELALHQWQRRRISDPVRDAENGEEFLFVFPQDELQGTISQTAASCPPAFFCFVAGLRKKDGKARLADNWKKNVSWQSDGDGKPVGAINPQFHEVVAAFCSAIEMAMLRRIESDSILSPDISNTFWNLHDDQSRFELRARPWDRTSKDRERCARTASLSFDLRSSTFVMEHAIDMGRHALWLNYLTQSLKEITQHHRGVFDKFTGDGVLVHFPIYAFEKGDHGASVKAVRNCVACAWDMVRAADFCGEYMLSNLSLKTRKFGAAAGVAYDDAVWSLDDAGNPIVVGRGVVQACRLSSGRDERGVVLATNAVIEHLKPLLGSITDACEVSFVSKEYSAESEVTCVRMTQPPVGLGSETGVIRDIVGRIFASWDGSCGEGCACCSTD